MKKPLILLVLGCAGALWSVGCAAPGAPQPPSLRLPAPVNNLSAVRKGNRVELTWSPPTQTTDRVPQRWPTTTRVCRVVNQYPITQCSTVAGELPSSELASTAPRARRAYVSFEDVLPAALLVSPSAGGEKLATYAVEVVNERGRSAGLSNQVRIPLLTTEPPPAAFNATLDGQGPLLHWEMSPGFPATPELACQLRIYRRVAGMKTPGPGDFVRIASQPCHAGAGEARDDSFEWEKEYDYKATVATLITTPGQPAAEVEGDDTPLVHVVAHDIFPPAVPAGLQAVFSSVGQKPFIDLTWAPDTESDLAGYEVYRSTGETDFVRITPELVKAPAWRDNDVQPGQQYFYTVTAVDVRGNRSARSAETSERVPQELR
jgi:hypothetical protein